MNYKTEAIVLGHLKHTDSRVILHAFTRDLGWVSFVTNIGGKKRPRALIQPMNLLELDFNFKESKELQTIQQIALSSSLNQIWSEVPRASVAMFMAEVLSKSLHRNYPNPTLFNFTRQMILDLDKEEHFASFPIRFMLGLAECLGIGIEIPETRGRYFFNPILGEWLGSAESKMCLSLETGSLLFDLLMFLGDAGPLPKLNSAQRSALLEVLILYLKEQLDMKREIKSHQVLEVVLH